MGIFDRVRKTFLTAGTPGPIESALNAQGMNQTSNLGPGRPLTPVQGYSVRPRASDYPVGVNIAVQGRQAWGRTSWAFLKEFTGSYDVARICINHKIDEIRSMDLLFQPATGVTSDVSDALAAARQVLAFPDREHPFDEWLSMWLENQLRYDAGVHYRRRNRAGEIIGLEILDGTTIVPKVDEHGRRPSAPAPAYSQVIKGMDNVEFTAEDLTYLRFRPQADSPYGLAPIESILMAVNTDVRFQWHLLQMFTDGSVPHGFMELPPDISSPDQVAEWQDYYDAVVMGDQAKLHQLVAVPAGFKVSETRPKAFDDKFSDYLTVKVAAAIGVVPQDLGLLKDVNRANGETQVDVQFRVNTLPWVRFVQSNLNRYLQHDLGLPVKVALDTGRDKEDRLTEAQAWKVYVETGFASMDEARQELLGLPIDNERPVPRGIITPRTGFVPLTSMLAISGPIDGQTAAPSHDVPLPLTPFDGVGGVLPEKLPGGPEYKRAPINPDEPQFPELEHVVPGSDVVNGMQTVGGVITKSSADAELVKFRAFVKARGKAGKWRDFEFHHVEPDVGERLNREAQETGSFFMPGTVTSESAVAGLMKGWRDTPERTPQLRFDLVITDFYQPVVESALESLIKSVNVSQVSVVKTADVSGLLGQDLSTDELDAAVRRIMADSYLAGAWASGEQVPGGVGLPGGFGQLVMSTDWDSWSPGNTDAALKAADGGLAELLSDSGVTVQNITGTILDQVGNRIAEGLSQGLASHDIATSLLDIAGSRSEIIAHTETARAMTAASFDVYKLNGVTEWDLITSAGACQVCLDVEAANPHPVSDTSDTPPIHPFCRCSSAPRADSISIPGRA